MHKDLRPIVKHLKRNGYTVAPTKGGHYGVYDGKGTLLQVIAGTPGKGRWLQNLRAELKRKGLI